MDANIVNIYVPCYAIETEYYKTPTLSVLVRFDLFPSTTGDWQTKIIDVDSKPKPVAGVNLYFLSQNNSHSYLKDSQTAILIVSIQNSNDEEDWTFAGEGLVLTHPDKNKFSLTTRVADEGKTLYVKIDNVGDIGGGTDTVDQVGFQYLAYCQNETGRRAFLSQDPSVGLGRVKS